MIYFSYKSNIHLIEVLVNMIKMLEMNPSLIRTIENPSDEMKKLAVSKDGLLLRYIKNATEEIKKLALNNNKEQLNT